MRAAHAEARVNAGADLNRRFNELVASYLEHLAQEEARGAAGDLEALRRRRS